MTPVEALAAALERATDDAGNCRVDDHHGPEFAAVLWSAFRASGFDVVPTGEPTLDVERWIDSLHEDHNGIVWTTKDELRQVYARLSSSDTGEHLGDHREFEAMVQDKSDTGPKPGDNRGDGTGSPLR